MATSGGAPSEAGGAAHDDESAAGRHALAPSAGEEGRAIPSTRLGALWFAVALGLALLVVVIVFIVENSRHVDVGFFGAHWTLPLGVDLLLAAALGGLTVFLLGSLRMLQLRRLLHRRHSVRETRSRQSP